jgi:hypothetical protein
LSCVQAAAGHKTGPARGDYGGDNAQDGDDDKQLNEGEALLSPVPAFYGLLFHPNPFGYLALFGVQGFPGEKAYRRG